MAAQAMLCCPQAERGGNDGWNAEQFDPYLESAWRTSIAGQPLCPREPVMGSLCAGEGRRLRGWGSLTRRFHLHLNSLAATELHSRLPRLSAAPILPEHRSRPNAERMQQQTHPARLRRRSSVPLTLLAQLTAPTVSNPGSEEHPQRAHYRLSWEERLARNAGPPGAFRVRIKLFGIPEVFAASLGLATA